MRRFEKDFEDKFGETPTIMNKMSHPEYKHMSATIICLKNNLKREFRFQCEHQLLYAWANFLVPKLWISKFILFIAMLPTLTFVILSAVHNEGRAFAKNHRRNLLMGKGSLPKHIPKLAVLITSTLSWQNQFPSGHDFKNSFSFLSIVFNSVRRKIESSGDKIESAAGKISEVLRWTFLSFFFFFSKMFVSWKIGFSVGKSKVPTTFPLQAKKMRLYIPALQLAELRNTFSDSFSS